MTRQSQSNQQNQPTRPGQQTRQNQQNQQSQQSQQNQQSLDTVIENRYNRQELIDGWNQEKLKQARVVVAGSDILANYVAMSLSALGFESIEIYGPGKMNKNKTKKLKDRADYSEGFIFPNPNEPATIPKAELIADFANKINPAVEAYSTNIDLSRDKNLNVIKKPDIIIDTSNDPSSKVELLEYAVENNCLFISLSSSNNIGKVGVYNPKSDKSDDELEKIAKNIIFHDMKGKKQDPITGMSISALAVDEARKYVMPIKNEKVLEDIIVHSLYSDKRFDNKKDRVLEGQDKYNEKTVLMIGAGALGNFMGLGLAILNIDKLIIFDKDVVEQTNLNRQPFFYNSVDRAKVPALIKELKKINPKVKYEGIEEFFGLEHDKLFEKNKIDLIVDCVDNDKTRALLNYYSNKYKIPFISSATSHNSGHVNVSVPGKTACLNCQREIDKYAIKGQQEQASQSCIYAPQASVITSNMATAGKALAEAKALLNPKKYGEPVAYELKYISQDEFRVGVLPLTKRHCECYKDEKMIRKWPKKMKHLYEKKPR